MFYLIAIMLSLMFSITLAFLTAASDGSILISVLIVVVVSGALSHLGLTLDEKHGGKE